ncbi:chaplin [Streptomyces siamensis]|uniref:LAXTG-anchored chaplin ChpB n=1 Tax=Streptomyces siamensis TaxID=1274986 RepID=A0ABP9JND1_9ACTN
MKRATRNGLIAAAAASGALAVTMPAHADSAADGTAVGSPGLISGNTIQLPVHVPVNACGNTVNVVGLLNPAAGNSCATRSDGGAAKETGASSTHGGAVAEGGAKDSPGLLSGNGVQLPVDLPVNVSGNSVNVVGVGNAAVGNEATNTSGGRPEQPATPTPPPAAPPKAHPRPVVPQQVPGQPVPALASTGAGQTGPTIAAGAALLLGGAVLYRRFRPVAVR